jgi:hypothetical protein
MSYKNPILQTNKILYDQDLEVETGYSTLLNGPIVLPNVTINGILNVISELDVTGNTFISANGVLNVTG